jgi:hypothetical protein
LHPPPPSTEPARPGLGLTMGALPKACSEVLVAP